MTDHWFWGLTLLAVLGWYSTITVKIACRGTADIRSMLKRLKERDQDQHTD